MSYYYKTNGMKGVIELSFSDETTLVDLDDFEEYIKIVIRTQRRIAMKKEKTEDDN